MPSANCSIVGCSTSRRHKGISIFRLPSKKKVGLAEWRSQLERLILKDRVIEKNLKNQVEKGNLHICDKHFKKDDIDSSEYVLFTSGLPHPKNHGLHFQVQTVRINKTTTCPPRQPRCNFPFRSFGILDVANCIFSTVNNRKDTKQYPQNTAPLHTNVMLWT